MLYQKILIFPLSAMIPLIMKVVFWLSLVIVFYSYVFYGIVIWTLIIIRNFINSRKRITFAPSFPRVTLLVAVYNEEAFIRQKIENTLQLDYPAEKLDILFVTDGSTDGTNAIIGKYPQINLLFQPERRGKVAAINRAMQQISTPIVIFCDANTLLNTAAIREIVKHYDDPLIGGVSGEKIVSDPEHAETLAGAGEGLYWKYESLLKKLDSEFWTVVGAAGELFSIRTSLFEPVHEDVLLDDLIISLRIAQKGYRIAYEPSAYAIESPSANIREEQKRKIRIGAGGYQSIVMLASLLNIFKYPKLSFQYISHRVLRWAVCPFLLPLIFVLNVALVFRSGESIYLLLLLMQVIFYLFAFAGYRQAQHNKKSRLFYIPYYFVFMNLSLYAGLKRYLNKSQSVLWEKSQRKTN